MLGTLLKLAVLATAAVLAVGAPAAAAPQSGGTARSASEPPEGFDRGLWGLLPQFDRDAILGVPYPRLDPARSAGTRRPSAPARLRVPTPPPGHDDYTCRPQVSLARDHVC